MSWLTTLRQGGRSHVHAPLLGIACMVASGLVVTVNNAAIKGVSPEMPISELIFVRGVFSLLVLAGPLVQARRLAELRVREPWGHVQFAALQVASMFLFVWSLRLMPLADVIALAFIGPVLVTALAPLMLAERVTAQRWGAVLVGFAGVVVMFRPGPDGFYWLALLPVATAFATSLRDILTRRIAAADSTLPLLVYANLAVMVSGLVTAPFDAWVVPGWFDLLLLAICGASFTVSNYFMYEAFRFGQAAVVAPFRYVALLWAGLAGFFFFGESPDLWMLGGAALIVGSGIALLRLSTR